MPKQVPESVAIAKLRALLLRAGVPAAAQPVSSTLSPTEAQGIIGLLVNTPPSLSAYGPRLVVLSLLREVATGGSGITLGALAERMRRFEYLVIVRPDGYLAGAFDGRAIERAGPVRVDRGAVRAGLLEVGAFYFKSQGNLFRVDQHLGCINGIVLELSLAPGLGAIDAVLDGVEGALASIAVGIAELIRDPIRSLQGLGQLPGVVAALIVNSPEYWQRFVAMPVGDQTREVTRMVTTVLLLYGSATGVATRLGEAAGNVGSLTVPVLRLGATGELAVATVSVPVGRIATALGGGPGAVYILHMAQATPPEGGTGVAAESKPQTKPEAVAQGAGAQTATAPASSFSIKSWAGYPSWAPKPTGPFRLLSGAEYDAARKAANAMNAALRKADPAKYAGKQIHEIHPVKFGGSPTDPANKIALTSGEHAQLTNFWNQLMRDLQ